MAKGIYRSKGDPNWVQVDYGNTQIPVSEAAYRGSNFLPSYENLPWESEYLVGQPMVAIDAQTHLQMEPFGHHKLQPVSE